MSCLASGKHREKTGLGMLVKFQNSTLDHAYIEELFAFEVTNRWIAPMNPNSDQKRHETPD